MGRNLLIALCHRLEVPDHGPKFPVPAHLEPLVLPQQAVQIQPPVGWHGHMALSQLPRGQEGHMGHLRQGLIGRTVQLQESTVSQPVISLLPQQTAVQVFQLLRRELPGVQVQAQEAVRNGNAHCSFGRPDLLVPQALGDIDLSIGMEGIQYIGEEMIGRLLPLQEEHMVVVLLESTAAGASGAACSCLGFRFIGSPRGGVRP